MLKKSILKETRKAIRQNTDEKTKQSFQRFFKEKVKYYGVKSAKVVQIAKDKFREIKELNKREIFLLCEELLKSGYCEESWIAANWIYWTRKNLAAEDFFVFEKWIDKYIDNWAECDTFCNHTIGFLVEKYPFLIDNLKKWAKSDNLWLRRAAAVSLIVPAKNGKFLSEVFQIADLLLQDKEDLVQKGYGWLLKEASRKNQKEVYLYVLKNKKEMPRTSLRYAVEKMPKNLKQEVMKK